MTTPGMLFGATRRVVGRGDDPASAERRLFAAPASSPGMTAVDLEAEGGQQPGERLEVPLLRNEAAQAGAQHR